MNVRNSLLILILAVAILFPCVVLATSDITDAGYLGEIDISNNGTIAYDVSVPFSVNTTSMIATGKLNATASDAAMRDVNGDDVCFMPGYGDNSSWITFVDQIGADTTITHYLYTCNVTGGEYRYFPGSAGMTVSDNETLELSDNFTHTFSGYIDTTAVGDNITSKEGALRTYVSGSGNVTASLYSELIQNAYNTDQTIGSAFYTRYAQRYDDFPISSINSVSFYLSKGGSPTGTANITVRTVSGDTLLGTIGTIDVSTISVFPTFTWYEFDTNVINNTSVQDLRFSFEYSGGDGSNYIRAKNNSTSVSDGQLSLYQGSWSDFSGDATYEAMCSISATVPGISSGEYEVEVGANSSIYNTLVDYGDVLHFAGSNSTHRVDFGELHNSESKFWVFTRFKLDEDFNDSSGTFQDLFSKSLDGTNYIKFQLRNDTGKLGFLQQLGGVGGCTLYSSKVEWNAGQVYSVLCSISDTSGGIQRMLIDGVLEISGTLSNKDTPAGGNLFIGYISTDCSNIIHDVVIGTDDLTSQEEQDLFDGIIPADAVNIWHLDEGSGLTATDRGTGGNDGTIGAGCTWEIGRRYTDFYIDVGGSSAGCNLYGASVADNSNDWIFFSGDAVPYMEYAEIEVAGVQKGYWEWEYATTFTDQSVNSNTATPTFRTASSDENVSAELVSFTGIKGPTPPPAGGTGWTMIVEVPTGPDSLLSELDMSFLGAGYIESFCESTDIPLALVVFPFAFGASIILGAIAWYLSSGGGKHPHGRGSLLVMASVSLLVMVYFVYSGDGVIPAWVLVPFGLEALAFIVWRQTPSPY